MDWNAKIFAYCERGLDPGFWAEPLNAVSNAAFLIAAGVSLAIWRRDRARRGGWMELALIALVGVIGIGSFLFHTVASRWAVIADTAPIAVFMLAYLLYALRVFAGAPWRWALPLLGLFVLALQGAEGVRCGTGPCLNGSLGYVPALLALALLGVWLRRAGHPAALSILAGAGVFAISLTLRTLDRTMCAATAFGAASPLGTHFLWHLANATLLFILLRAALHYGTKRPA